MKTAALIRSCACEEAAANKLTQVGEPFGDDCVALSQVRSAILYFLQYLIARDDSFKLAEIGAMHYRNKRDLIDVAESGFKCVIGMEVG